jgi:hypothetical protein
MAPKTKLERELIRSMREALEHAQGKRKLKTRIVRVRRKKQ